MKSFKKFIAISLCLPAILCSSCYAGQGWDNSVANAGESYANKQYAADALQFYVNAGIPEDILDCSNGRMAMCRVLNLGVQSQAKYLIDRYVECLNANGLNNLRGLVSSKLTEILAIRDKETLRCSPDLRSRYCTFAKTHGFTSSEVKKVLKKSNPIYIFFLKAFGKNKVTSTNMLRLIFELCILYPSLNNYAREIKSKDRGNLSVIIEWFEDRWIHIRPLILLNFDHLVSKGIFNPSLPINDVLMGLYPERRQRQRRTPQAQASFLLFPTAANFPVPMAPTGRVPLPPITSFAPPTGFNDNSSLVDDTSEDDIPGFF